METFPIRLLASKEKSNVWVSSKLRERPSEKRKEKKNDKIVDVEGARRKGEKEKKGV